MKQISFTLGEGQTPLIRSRNIGPAAGISQLYFKMESLNPTGSYKDRFAAAAVTDMLARGDTSMVGSSSGNAGAAMAAYCAAAGLKCQIAVVCGAPDGKLKQMLAYGAQLWKIREFGINPEVTRSVLDYLCELGQHPGTRLQITAYCHSPVGMTGVEQISHELAEQMTGHQINHVFVPAGGGGLILAIVRGFETAVQSGRFERGPRVHCVQPEGNDTIAGALRAEKLTTQACLQSTTRISGLQVPNLLDGQAALTACRQTRGTGFLVSDQLIFETQSRLAREEGIFCEPAAAAALAGALAAVKEGVIHPDETVICIVTGAGFKDLESVDQMIMDQNCPLIHLTEFRALFNENALPDSRPAEISTEI